MAHADVDDLAALVIGPADVPDPVRRHVDGCSRCSATVEALTTTRGALGSDPLVAPPADLRARVMAEALGRPTATATPAETGTGETPPSAPVPLASRRREDGAGRADGDACGAARWESMHSTPSG